MVSAYSHVLKYFCLWHYFPMPRQLWRGRAMQTTVEFKHVSRKKCGWISGNWFSRSYFLYYEIPKQKALELRVRLSKERGLWCCWNSKSAIS